MARNRTNGIITFSWFIGISIQITLILITNSLILNIVVSISGIFQNRTFGLLGLYDNNPLNYTNENLRYISKFTFPQLSESQINTIIYSVCNINPLLNDQSTDMLL